MANIAFLGLGKMGSGMARTLASAGHTLVVWNLVPTDKGTELFLEHSGFGKTENLNFYQGMTDGWVKNVQKIMNLLNAAQHGTTRA